MMLQNHNIIVTELLFSAELFCEDILDNHCRTVSSTWPSFHCSSLVVSIWLNTKSNITHNNNDKRIGDHDDENDNDDNFNKLW